MKQHVELSRMSAKVPLPVGKYAVARDYCYFRIVTAQGYHNFRNKGSDSYNDEHCSFPLFAAGGWQC